jgi:hypothetical protein
MNSFVFISVIVIASIADSAATSSFADAPADKRDRTPFVFIRVHSCLHWDSVRFSSTDSAAADFVAPAAFAIHPMVSGHPPAQSGEYVTNQRIALLRPAIMHPFAVTACFY